jgi:hypothetical protein
VARRCPRLRRSSRGGRTRSHATECGAETGSQHLRGRGPAGNVRGLCASHRAPQLRLSRRSRSTSRLPHGVVVLHGQRGDRGRAPLRLPAHVLSACPGRRGSAPRVGLGRVRRVHGALCGDRCCPGAVPPGRALCPWRAGPGGSHGAAVPRLDRRLVGGGRGRRCLSHAPARGSREGRPRHAPRRGKARRLAWRARAQPQELRGGQRLLLLLLHANAHSRHDWRWRRALHGHRQRVDGPRVVDERAGTGSSGLGLVRASTLRRARPDDLPIATARRVHRSVQRRHDRRRRWRGPSTLCGRGDRGTDRLVDEPSRRHAVPSGLAASHSPGGVGARGDTAGRRPGNRRGCALLGGRRARPGEGGPPGCRRAGLRRAGGLCGLGPTGWRWRRRPPLALRLEHGRGHGDEHRSQHDAQ